MAVLGGKIKISGFLFFYHYPKNSIKHRSIYIEHQKSFHNPESDKMLVHGNALMIAE